MAKPTVLVWTFAVALATPAAAQDATTDIWEGVFTEEQVERGREAYMNNCASCHGEDLVGTTAEIPTLTAPAFRWSWQTRTIAEKFERIHTTMPPTSPGSLEDQTYADIVAYILNFNDYPTGEIELTPDMERLEQIVIALEEDG